MLIIFELTWQSTWQSTWQLAMYFVRLQKWYCMVFYRKDGNPFISFDIPCAYWHWQVLRVENLFYLDKKKDNQQPHPERLTVAISVRYVPCYLIFL